MVNTATAAVAIVATASTTFVVARTWFVVHQLLALLAARSIWYAAKAEPASITPMAIPITHLTAVLVCGGDGESFTTRRIRACLQASPLGRYAAVCR